MRPSGTTGDSEVNCSPPEAWEGSRQKLATGDSRNANKTVTAEKELPCAQAELTSSLQSVQEDRPLGNKAPIPGSSQKFIG